MWTFPNKVKVPIPTSMVIVLISYSTELLIEIVGRVSLNTKVSSFQIV